MKNKLLLFILLCCNTIYAQKPIYVKPKWQKNQQLDLTLTKYYSFKNDSLNHLYNYKVDISLKILDITKNGYVAEFYYKNFISDFNNQENESEAFLIKNIQHQKIKVLLSEFGKPIWLFNTNEVDNYLAQKFLSLTADPKTEKEGDYGLSLLSKNNFIENQLFKALKVYCISTERPVILNKNNSFFKAHENARAQGVVSFKAFYGLKNNLENTSLQDLNFSITYDKSSLEQVAKNLKFTNPNANVVVAMKGLKYNLVDVEKGIIFKATDSFEIKFEKHIEKIIYEVKIL